MDHIIYILYTYAYDLCFINFTEPRAPILSSEIYKNKITLEGNLPLEQQLEFLLQAYIYRVTYSLVELRYSFGNISLSIFKFTCFGFVLWSYSAWPDNRLCWHRLMRWRHLLPSEVL